MSFRFRRAIVRRPAATYHQGLTTGQPGPCRIELFLRQHAAYVDALARAGLEVEVLEALDEFPDAHFVEDVAVIVREVAVLARPGALARRGEAERIEPALRRHGEPVRIEEPGTLDGGDVLVIGRRCFIGLSGRTNAEGARQLTRVLEGHGYRCETIAVGAGLHLKSSINGLDDETVVVTGELRRHEAFRPFRRVEVDAGEAYAANLLRVNDLLIVPEGYPATIERVAALGVEIVALDVSEARRMDGGLTCMSLRF